MRTSVHHRIYWQGNQGATAQCTCYGSVAMWEAGRGHARGAGHPLHGIIRPIVRPADLYARAQQLDPWPGSETEDPKYEGSSGTAAAAAMKDLGLITGYDWEFNDIEVCERAIFTAPLGFGIDWKAGMMLDGQPRTKWEDAVVKNAGADIGGHFVAVVGYDKRRKGAEFEILNSWGREWGLEGRCFIGRDDLGALLAADGECMMLRDAEDKDVAAALAK
jgi:hypothetical protein